MKKIRKVLGLVLLSFLVVSQCFTVWAKTSNEMPIVSSVQEALERGLKEFRVYETSKDDQNTKDLGGWYEYKNTQTSIYKKQNLGYHKDIPRWRTNVSGDYFSNSSKTTWSASISLNSKLVSVGVSAAKGGTSGFIVEVDKNKVAMETRPYVIGDVTHKTADMYTYDNFGNLLSIVKGVTLSANSSNENIYIAYR